MPRAWLALALVASACAYGGGIGPDDTLPPTTTATTTTTTVPPDPDDLAAAAAVARSFYDAIAASDLAGAEEASNGSVTAITSALAAWGGELDPDSIAFEVGPVHLDGDRATAAVTASLDVPGIGIWEYTTQAHLIRESSWLVDWSPGLLHPELEDRDRLEVRADWPLRGSILAIDGRPLARHGPVHVIGVVPQWIEDLDALSAELEAVAGIAPETVAEELSRPGVQPDWFVPVGSIDPARGDDVAVLLQTPGVVLRDGEGRILPEGDLAAHVVGRTAPITAEQLAVWGPPYSVGDVVGRSGLEAAFQPELAGAPDLRIVRVNRFGRELGDLHAVPGLPAADVHTTLDIDAQRVVDAALDGVELPAAIVLLDVATGGIRASANRPVDGLDRALLGLYPPGSSFKVVTASALLGAGLTTTSAVDCPAEVVVGGLRVRNAGGRDLSEIDLRTAFAESCNTTFASLAGGLLTDGELSQHARTLFGFDTSYDPGLATATSRFPDPVDTAERAAQAIGQGRVLVTPLHQASVAAAVAGMGWIQPTMLADDDQRARIPMAADVQVALAAMMRQVVTDGTGTAADVDGVVVAGKTGSAEYDDSGDTHAWFIGFWEGYAIAVVIEAGGSGGQVAAPIAAQVIAALDE